jgi:hypothetical protein
MTLATEILRINYSGEKIVFAPFELCITWKFRSCKLQQLTRLTMLHNQRLKGSAISPFNDVKDRFMDSSNVKHQTKNPSSLYISTSVILQKGEKLYSTWEQ